MKIITKVITIVFVLLNLTSVAQVIDSGRIFISHDRGVNWKKSDDGFPTDDVVNVLVFKGNLVFAGTDKHGVMVSTRAEKWYQSHDGLPRGVRIISMVEYSGVIFAGTYQHGIYVSKDDGESWYVCNNGLPNRTIRALSSSGRFLFAGTNSGIYRSSDYGAHWTVCLEGPGTAPLQINNFALDRSGIYAATNKGVIRSINQGQTWQSIFDKGAISTLRIRDNEVCILDYSGVVFRANVSSTPVWLREEFYFPMRSSFQLTSSSPKLLTAGLNQDVAFHVNANNGLPQNGVFMEIIITPFGILTFSRRGSGC